MKSATKHKKLTSLMLSSAVYNLLQHKLSLLKRRDRTWSMSVLTELALRDTLAIYELDKLEEMRATYELDELEEMKTCLQKQLNKNQKPE